MVSLVCYIELYLPDVQSLKSKRQVIKSLIGRIKAKCNVSIAETDYQDLWQRSGIGIAIVGSERSIIDGQVALIRRLVDDVAEAETVAFTLDYY